MTKADQETTNASVLWNAFPQCAAAVYYHMFPPVNYLRVFLYFTDRQFGVDCPPTLVKMSRSDSLFSPYNIQYMADNPALNGIVVWRDGDSGLYIVPNFSFTPSLVTEHVDTMRQHFLQGDRELVAFLMLPGPVLRIFVAQNSVYIADESYICPLDMMLNQLLREQIQLAVAEAVAADPMILVNHVLFYSGTTECVVLFGKANIRRYDNQYTGALDFEFTALEEPPPPGATRCNKQWLLVNRKTLFAMRFASPLPFLYMPLAIGLLQSDWDCLSCWVLVQQLSEKSVGRRLRTLLRRVFGDSIHERAISDHWDIMCYRLAMSSFQVVGVLVALGCQIKRRSRSSMLASTDVHQA